MIPRFQAKIGQCEEAPDPKWVGKWFFEVFVSILGEGRSLSVGQFGPWETREIAEVECQRAVRMAVEDYERRVVGTPSGKFIDMKTNQTKEWEVPVERAGMH